MTKQWHAMVAINPTLVFAMELIDVADVVKDVDFKSFPSGVGKMADM